VQDHNIPRIRRPEKAEPAHAAGELTPIHPLAGVLLVWGSEVAYGA